MPATTEQRLAEVITFPLRSSTRTAALFLSTGTQMAGEVLRRWSSSEVDNWGRDSDFVSRVWGLSRLRWDVSVGNAERLPQHSGALIIVNARRFALAPLFAAFSLGAEVDRPVRFVGRPDYAPLGPIIQRLGGLQSIPDELTGALRAGELVVLGTDHEISNRVSGALDHRLVGAAVAAAVPVFPAATHSAVNTRHARLDIGTEITAGRDRRGPLRELEMANAVVAQIDQLLEEFGGVATGSPLEWLPINGIGGR